MMEPIRMGRSRPSFFQLVAMVRHHLNKARKTGFIILLQTLSFYLLKWYFSFFKLQQIIVSQIAEVWCFSVRLLRYAVSQTTDVCFLGYLELYWFQAILSREGNQMTVADIYEWIRNNYSQFAVENKRHWKNR